MLGLLIGALVCGMPALVSLGHAQDAKAPEERGEDSHDGDFYPLLVGNTVYATTSQGNNFIEYHAPDGRVLGYNWDNIKNYRSCWYARGKNIICYYYENPPGVTQLTNPGEHCWEYTRTGLDTFSGVATTGSQTTLVARIVKGNPDNLSGFGVEWSCGRQVASR